MLFDATEIDYGADAVAGTELSLFYHHFDCHWLLDKRFLRSRHRTYGRRHGTCRRHRPLMAVKCRVFDWRNNRFAASISYGSSRRDKQFTSDGRHESARGR